MTSRKAHTVVRYDFFLPWNPHKNVDPKKQLGTHGNGQSVRSLLHKCENLSLDIAHDRTHL